MIVSRSECAKRDLFILDIQIINPYCPTDVLIFGVPNMHRKTQKMIQLGWILLSNIHKHLENKKMNNNLIGAELFFPVQIGQGFVEWSFERLWRTHLVRMRLLE